MPYRFVDLIAALKSIHSLFSILLFHCHLINLFLCFFDSIVNTFCASASQLLLHHDIYCHVCVCVCECACLNFLPAFLVVLSGIILFRVSERCPFSSTFCHLVSFPELPIQTGLSFLAWISALHYFLFPSIKMNLPSFSR